MQTASLMLALCVGAGDPETVLYDFGAPRCFYCQVMNPVVDRLIGEGHPIEKINVDQDPTLARRFQVQSLPTFVLVVNGQEAGRVVGQTTEQELRRLLARIPRPAPAEPPPVVAGNHPPASSAAPPSSSAVQLGQPAAFPGTITAGGTLPERSRTPAGPTSTNPSSATPAVPTGQTLPRDRVSPPMMELAQAPAGPNRPQVLGNHEDASRESEFSAAAGIATMAASVRIRVLHNGRVNLGSGTVVASRVGNSLVVTCGHIFKEIGQNARIEVDVFTQQGPVTYVGRLIDFDLESEVGLVTIPTEQEIPRVPIIPPGRTNTVNDRVACIGCSGGSTPSREQLRITALNKYDGPDNIECSGIPVEGRSGGGLFNERGELVGVCFAANEQQARGLYAGPRAIYALFDRIGWTAIYQEEPVSQPPAAPAVLADATATGEAPDPFANSPASRAGTGESGFPQQDRPFVDLGAVSHEPPQSVSAPAFPRSPASSGMAAYDPVDVDTGRAEVVCVITQPDGSRRVVVIHQASPKFMAYLNGELSARESVSVEEHRRAERYSSSRIPRPTQQPLISLTSAEHEVIDMVDKGELLPTSLVQPMQPRRYVRQR